MPTTARELQVVLNIAKEWYMLSFRALLVNGQLAVEDANYKLFRYVSRSFSKLQIEWQRRGAIHAHYSAWQVRGEDEEPCLDAVAHIR